ncbi:MAG: hypothetical protein CMG60_04325 [Candidatus Marinimicrobia bacterium]|nr:hypothetical protein [Candidatus Neomarinimicrobiota bacterium]
MNFIEGVILGVIQGFTEFLPISSSGHLVLAQELLGIKQPGNEFEILVHIGTLCSILVVFYNDIKCLLFSLRSKQTQKFLFFVTIGTMPAVAIGLGLKDELTSLFDNNIVVASALMFTGIVLICSYFFKIRNKKQNIIISILIGFAQAIAIIPGVSRSGMTISCGLMLGLDSKIAARYSFLLAIPIIGGAGILTAIDLDNNFQMELFTSLSAFVSSFIVGILALKWLLGWLEDGKFHYFGVYCLIIGAIVNVYKWI